MTNFSPLSTNGRGGVSGLSEVTGAKKKIRAVGSQPVNPFMLSTNQEVLQPTCLLLDETWRSYQTELLGMLCPRETLGEQRRAWGNPCDTTKYELHATKPFVPPKYSASTL